MSYSEHFTAKDFACRCGCGYGSRPEDCSDERTQLLEATRSAIGRPIVLTSGNRCPRHNLAVGGTTNSSHLRGTAADCRARSALERYELLVGAVVGALWLAGALKCSPHAAMAGIRRAPGFSSRPGFGLTGLGVGKDFVHVECDSELYHQGLRPAAWGYAGEHGEGRQA